MNKIKNLIQRTSTLAILLVFAVMLVGFMKTKAQDGEVKAATEEWEYLALAGPSTTNFTPTGNPRMRKEPNAGFGREAFVLEQHLDKLGANGWELIAVAGPPTDLAYYFKRWK